MEERRQASYNSKAAKAGRRLRFLISRRDLLSLSTEADALLARDSVLQKTFCNVSYRAASNEMETAEKLNEAIAAFVKEALSTKLSEELALVLCEKKLLQKELEEPQNVNKIRSQLKITSISIERSHEGILLAQDIQARFNAHADYWSVLSDASIEPQFKERNLRQSRRAGCTKTVFEIEEIISKSLESISETQHVINEALQVISTDAYVKRAKKKTRTKIVPAYQRRLIKAAGMVLAGGLAVVLAARSELETLLAVSHDSLVLRPRRSNFSAELRELKDTLQEIQSKSRSLRDKYTNQSDADSAIDLLGSLIELSNQAEKKLLDYRFDLFNLETKIVQDANPFNEQIFHNAGLHRNLIRDLEVFRRHSIDLLFICSSQFERITSELTVMTDFSSKTTQSLPLFANHLTALHRTRQMLEQHRDTITKSLNNVYRIKALLLARRSRHKELARYKQELAKAKKQLPKLSDEFRQSLKHCNAILDNMSQTSRSNHHSVKTHFERLFERQEKLNALPDGSTSIQLCLYLGRDTSEAFVAPFIHLLRKLDSVVSQTVETRVQTKPTNKSELEELHQQFRQVEWLQQYVNKVRRQLLMRIHHLECYLSNSNSAAYSLLNQQQDNNLDIPSEVLALRKQVGELETILNSVIRTQYRLAKIAKAGNITAVLRNSRPLNVLQKLNEDHPQKDDIEKQVIASISIAESVVVQMKDLLDRVDQTLLTGEGRFDQFLSEAAISWGTPNRNEVRSALAEALATETILRNKLKVVVNRPLYLNCLEEDELWQRRVLIAQKISDHVLEQQAQIRLASRQEKLAFYELYISEREIGREDLPEFVSKTLETVERIEKKCGIKVNPVLRQGKVMLLLTFMDRIIFLLEKLYQFGETEIVEITPE